MTSLYKHVFVSYCRDNKAQVKRLCDDLLRAGERIWWDQNIVGGQDWKYAIRQAMRESYAILLCLSQESEDRTTSGIYPEALAAIAAYRQYPPNSIFLIPVRLSACSIPPIEIDDTRTLERLQYIDLYPESVWDEGVSRLVEALRHAPYHP